LLASTNGQDVTLRADHTTIVGGATGQYGASIIADASSIADLVLKSSIIDGVDHSLKRSAMPGGAAHLTTTYSNYPPPLPGDDAGTGGKSETANMSAAPSFVNPAAGNFHLSPGSPLIDAGEPGPAPPGEPATDIDGNPRRLDGNGDCDPRRDIGAFEFVPANVATRMSAPTSAYTGTGVTFDGSGSCDPDPSATLTYTWSFDDGGTATGAVVQHSFASAGAHSATLSVASTAGRTGAATRTIVVSAPPVAAQSGPPPPPGPLSRKRPRPLVLISGRPVAVSARGTVLIALRCKGVRRCTGVLSLETARPVDASARKRVVKLGSARFSIRASRTTRVRVKLSKRGLAVVRKLRQLRVNATVTDRDSAGRKRSSTRAIVLKAGPRGSSNEPARHEIAG
jgi:hypothetical protein